MGVVAKVLAAIVRWAIAHPATVKAGISDGIAIVHVVQDAKSGK